LPPAIAVPYDLPITNGGEIEGLQVRSEITINMMGTDMKSTHEIIEMSNGEPPAGIYDVPAGYKKQNQFSMQDFAGQ
jgi:hypothetical protein